MRPIRHADGVYRHIGTDDTMFSQTTLCFGCANASVCVPSMFCIDCVESAGRDDDDEDGAP